MHPLQGDVGRTRPSHQRKEEGDVIRILITGSRDWEDRNLLNDTLNEYAGASDIVVVHGACPTGADKMADEWVAYQGVRVERHPAWWISPDGYDPRAGFRRNAAMVRLGADVCLAFINRCTKPDCTPQPHGSHGATHTADLAEKAGIPTRRFTS